MYNYEPFESAEEAVEFLMSDPNQAKLYKAMCSEHPDDRINWLDGVLDCAEAYGIQCDGLQYVREELDELGPEATVNMIDEVYASIKGGRY